ncbi:molybdopterin-dependent oxidoreductase [Limibaculum sp. M0105]|uniref:Molybdopterin-dependent oxidoreductase n=1 Tax=Thermohalobaculum xanthum TaxID=2753746 RepID=A0A8J7M4X3_9RHOB|nr:nitrate reductase [Thermohalobaculum xanthum]MBK0398215.1 molybdopterin-dependent oxidoreductase [Thermohalobaculum xanthum]
MADGQTGARSDQAVVRTACPYCGVGCGVLATPDGKGGARVTGDPGHPSNFGRLCSKGAALGETLDLEGRLLHPLIGGRRSGWDEAIGLVAEKFDEAIRLHGPDSVAIYASGQLLTEDYYVANKLMKGFIGSANIDTNSRLCMASSVAGHRRAFGADIVPGTYEDLEEADLVVLVGSNLAWCHPVLFQRLSAAKEARPGLTVVNIDPRHTATSELADLELCLRPGSDVALFNGLLNAIEADGAIDADYVATHVAGLPEALGSARRMTPAEVARLTGLTEDELARFYSLWVRNERVVTVYSQGVNQSSAGTDKVNAILNCHLATGRIGRPGAGPFSVTGQPNAMGGREVGGLANMLACHLEIEDDAHRAVVQAFWHSPRICAGPGLKAVDLFRACADGRIKALWIMSTNPAVSLPEADSVRAAIAACPFVVVSDIMAETDTTAVADVVLPAAGWGEKSGTVTNSERRISRQRAFLAPPGEARPDWKIVCDVARRMGWGDAFAYESPAAILREHAALSGVAAGLGRGFDISGLAGLTDDAYEALTPVQWPISAAAAGGRFFATGGFYHPDGLARMIAVEQGPEATPCTAALPLRLNTGRVRDHWHTMTRTAKSPRLSRHMAEPFVEMHPEDAAAAGIAPAGLALVESPHGRLVARAVVTKRTRRGNVFVPMHWTAQWASRGRAGALVRAVTDPVSGQPDLKASAVRVSPFAVGWHGFAMAARPFTPATAYWARARLDGAWQAELADAEAPEDWTAFARDLFGVSGGETVSVVDHARGTARIAIVEHGRVAGALFAAPGPVEVARAHVRDAVRGGATAAEILAGRPGAARKDPGAIVCACFDIGANTILEAIEMQGLVDVAHIGRALRAGTNCGSCLPELRALIARVRPALAAE